MMEVKRSAVISKDGLYRYALHRQWSDGNKFATWIMLNPSTADGEVDDATIRRCIGFSFDWGMDGLHVVNLFPLRATDPRELRGHVEPKEVLKLNLEYIDAEAHWNAPEVVVCAWGVNGQYKMRNKETIQHLLELGANLSVLRLSEDRHPVHPLYLPKKLKPILWNGR